MNDMTPIERVGAALNGAEVDRPPVSLWQHFPERDQTAANLTAATAEWQDTFRFDLIKFMPPGDYPTIDWGGISEYQGAIGGTRTTTTFPVNGLEDWDSIQDIDVNTGFNRVMLDAVEQSVDAVGQDVPLFQTIFSPLTVAMKLSNGAVLRHLDQDRGIIESAVERITKVTRAMLERSLARGAAGIFFASQCADRTVMTEDDYRRLALSGDQEVLSGLGDDTMLIIHLHGDQPMLSLAGDYPPGFLNWHDRRVGPALDDVHAASNRPVVGGIDEKAISSANRDAMADQARDAVTSMNRTSVVIAPGCVVPSDTPRETIYEIARAVRNND